MVRLLSHHHRSQLKKMKKEEEKYIVYLDEDQGHEADEQGSGRPGARVGFYTKAVGGGSVGDARAEAAGGGPRSGQQGTQVQPPEAGRAGPPGLRTERGGTRLLWGCEPGRDIL